MPAERYYFPFELTLFQDIKLEGQELHHLSHVMRARVGQELELVNGKGYLAKGILTSLNKREAKVSIQKIEQREAPSFDMILAQALPRANRLDAIVEKATELGVTQLWLFASEKSERKELSVNQHQRLESIMLAAMKQSGRLWLPQLIFKAQLKECISCTYPLFFGDTDAEAPLFAMKWQAARPLKGAVFVIGPESGFSLAEENWLRENKGQGVKLNDNTLRTDTAAIAAICLMAHFS